MEGETFKDGVLEAWRNITSGNKASEISQCVQFCNGLPRQAGVIPIPIAAIALQIIKLKDPSIDTDTVLDKACIAPLFSVPSEKLKGDVARLAMAITSDTDVKTLTRLISECCMLDHIFLNE